MTRATPNSKPVTRDGVTWPSQSALARALGVPVTNVSRALRNGTLETLGQGRAVALALAHAARRQPVAALGWSWPSQTACARDLGVSSGTVSTALNEGRFEDLVRRHMHKLRRVP